MSFQEDATNTSEENTLRFCVLASGSTGNCAYLATPRARILVDAGLSAREIERRLASIGVTLAEIDAVLVTHEHSDHVCGLSTLARKGRMKVYANSFTADTLLPKMGAFDRWERFETGCTFQIGDIEVASFRIPHDACDPTGYTLSWENQRVGILTDLGYVTQLALEQAKSCTVALLEANHDQVLLQGDTKRPWVVKQRILSRHGHLSNDAAAELAAELARGKLTDIFLGHLSADCNRPELARQVVEQALHKVGALHVRIHETYQEKATPLHVFRAGV